MYTKGVPFLSKNGPQGSLHEKCKLHIKLCTLKIQIKNISANKKRTFLQIKKDVAANKKSPLQIKKTVVVPDLHIGTQSYSFQASCKNTRRWVPSVLVVGGKPAKNQSIAQLVAFPYNSRV